MALAAPTSPNCIQPRLHRKRLRLRRLMAKSVGGIAPGRYQAILPTFISGWDGDALKASVAFGALDQGMLAPPERSLERRYALRAVKQRLHQASFREAVIAAYNGRCALSGLPEPLLLDAAHIVSDKHERLGQPVVPNGIPLS